MFSVVIPAYGTAPHLEDCLRALASQSATATEIIVFHTGPEDPTESVGRTLPTVRVYHEDARQFAGGARNKGAALASGDWLAFLDCDVIACRNWLQHLEASAEQHRSDVLIGSIGRRSEGLWGPVMWLIEFGSVLPHRSAQTMSSAPSANFAIRRAIFEQTKGFRADLYAAEDGELFTRLRESGHELRLIPAARADHIFHGGAVRSLRRLGELGRAAAFLRRHKSLPGAAAVRYPPLALLLPFARLAQMARRLIVEKGPVLLFLALAPLIFAGLISWSIGFYREARHPTYPTDQVDRRR